MYQALLYEASQNSPCWTGLKVVILYVSTGERTTRGEVSFPIPLPLKFAEF